MLWWILLSGCGLSSEGIADVLRANTRVLTGVQVGLESIESPVDEGQTFHAAGDGEYRYEGIVDGGGLWSRGVVEVSGTASVRDDGTRAMFALDLDYQGVEVDGLLLDGVTSNGHAVFTDSGALRVVYDVLGTLTVDGNRQGKAVLDYRVSSDSSAGGFPVYEGTVNGRSVE